jgi:Zn-dependent protease with chaperone function
MATAFDFQAQQARVRRASVLFVLAFLAMAAAIGVVVGVIAGFAFAPDGPRGQTAGMAGPAALQIDPGLAAGAAAITMAVIVGVALIRLVAFSGDGARVAQALGAEEVTDDTRNPYKRRYLNVVEEMAIAAALPRPRTFVLKHEDGINAFAAGHDPERAAVGVTHGALAKLTRQELAGVVGHEMAHIRNRDSRLNMRLMAMVYGLVALYVLGRGFLYAMAFRRRRGGGRGAAPILPIGLALFVLGLLGALFGRILQSAVSRRREYLADATAVEFTRNPVGLANALKKIGATQPGSRVNNSHAEEARHMFFAQASASVAGLFATHPPLIERIRALEPDFEPETDETWTKDDKAILWESRKELGPWASAGPWGARSPTTPGNAGAVRARRAGA